MNKQGEGKIEWCTSTWNPITGCRGGCSYCYARKMYARFKRSFEPSFHFERLDEPFKAKNPSRIFVCSVSDFWGDGVDQEWRNQVYEVVYKLPQHTFCFLTKHPQNMTLQDWDHMPRKNTIVGVTHTSGQLEPHLFWTIENWKEIPKSVSIEPLLGEVNLEVDSYFPKPQWVIIGGMSGNRSYCCDPCWVSDVVKWCDSFSIPVFMKENLRKWWSGEWRQEFPRGNAG